MRQKADLRIFLVILSLLIAFTFELNNHLSGNISHEKNLSPPLTSNSDPVLDWGGKME